MWLASHTALASFFRTEGEDPIQPPTYGSASIQPSSCTTHLDPPENEGVAEDSIDKSLPQLWGEEEREGVHRTLVHIWWSIKEVPPPSLMGGSNPTIARC